MIIRWAFLELHTSAYCDDEKQAYAAGYLEGYLTRDLIWMHWQNMLKGLVAYFCDLVVVTVILTDLGTGTITTLLRNYKQKTLAKTSLALYRI